MFENNLSWQAGVPDSVYETRLRSIKLLALLDIPLCYKHGLQT